MMDATPHQLSLAEVRLIVHDSRDRVRCCIWDGWNDNAQRHMEEALPTHSDCPELHEVLLELVAAQPALKGCSERLLTQV